MILSPDDLELEMFVTIHSGTSEPIPCGGEVVTKVRYGHMAGDVFIVEAIQFPFVVIKEICENKFSECHAFSLDVRINRLMKLEEAYVLAIIGKPRLTTLGGVKCSFSSP